LRLDLFVDFARGARFPCPAKDRGKASCPVRGTADKMRRHMDFFRHRVFLYARLPRVRCPVDEVRQVGAGVMGAGGTVLSTRDMIETLIAGERDSRQLAKLTRGWMKAKRGELIIALDGHFDDHHAKLARMLLGQIDALAAQIDTLSVRIEELIAELPDAVGTIDDSGPGAGRGAGITSGPDTGADPDSGDADPDAGGSDPTQVDPVTVQRLSMDIAPVVGGRR
jgi:transposase